jgi:DNA helicase-2/ATP-dependent DNA helicase PcrA
VADTIRGQYDEVIVDEFQDINPLDQRLIEIISRDATLIITGDDDQAIYGFRWASSEHLIRPDAAFKRRFTSYELRTNYRCPRVILDRSRQLIGHNADRVAKNPVSGVASPGAITVIEHETRLAEAHQVATIVTNALSDSPDLTFSDVGILTRRNAHLDEIQVQLIARGIPYAIRAERDLVSDWEAVLALLDLSTALRRGKDTVVTDYRAAIANFKWLPRSVRHDGLHHFAGLAFPEVELSLRQANTPSRTLKQFTSALSHLRLARSIALELDVIEERFLGYAGPGRNRPKSGNDDAPPEESSLGLLRTILEKRQSTRPEAIERLRVFISRAVELREDPGPRVVLSTYHSAKGRQWKIVVLPWVSSLSTPDPLTRKEFGELESERRLFYVAMTRAADRLIVGRPSEASKEFTSQFVYEAGILPRPKFRPNGRERTAPAPARTTGRRKINEPAKAARVRSARAS